MGACPVDGQISDGVTLAIEGAAERRALETVAPVSSMSGAIRALEYVRPVMSRSADSTKCLSHSSG